MVNNIVTRHSASTILLNVVNSYKQYGQQQQGNLFEHAQDKSAWTRGNCVCLREI